MLRQTLIFLMIVAGCQQKTSSPGVEPAAQSTQNQQSGQLPISSVSVNPLIGATLNAGAYKDYREWLYALAECSCEPELVKTELRAFATTRGVLPQILVPTIRDEIKNNSKLKALTMLPFGQLLQSIFANDSQVTNEITSTLKQRLAGALGIGGLALGIQTRLDHFINFRDQTKNTETFNVTDQALRWNLVWSFPALWESTFALDGRDQAVQLLETVRTVSEWAYAIGIDSSGKAATHGGLMRDSANPDFLVGPYDPGTAVDRTRFFSGTCKISYGQGSAVTMATDINESWSCSTNDPTLGEQALIATSAARGFARMRVDKRGKIPMVFNNPNTSNKLLPYNAHEIALAFLPGYKGLLTNNIITKDSHEILQTAFLKGNLPSPKPLADLRSILRFMASARAWIDAVQNVEASGVRSELVPTLKEIPTAMRPALQLATRDVINRYTGIIKWQDGRNMMAVLEEDGRMTANVAKAAQAIQSLAIIDQKDLPSALLRAKVLSLFAWYNAALLPQAKNLQGEDLLWTKILYRTIDAYGLSVHQQAWLADARKQIGQ